MTAPTFFLPAVKNNVTTAQLVGAIGAGDTSIALKTGHGAQFGTILRGDCSSTGSGILLNDTGALGSVAVGDFIYNLTDGSFAIVTSIGGAPNSVATTPLEGGSDNTWQSGDIWVVGMFIATIVQYDTDGVTVLKRERVRVTNLVSDTLTVERAYDGDSSQTFLANDYVQMLIEKSQMENLQKAVRNILQKVNTNTTDIAANKVLDQNSTQKWLGTITGTNTLTGSLTPNLTAYASGQRFAFIVANSNSGAVTLNVNGLGAKNIKRVDGATALVTGDFIAGQVVTVVYDGTNFQMQTPAGTAASAPNVINKYVLAADSNDLTSGTGYSAQDWNAAYTIPASGFAVGVMYQMEAYGIISTSSDVGFKFFVKLGSGTVITFTAETINSASGTSPWKIMFTATCRSIGVSGTVHIQAKLEVHKSSMLINNANFQTFYLADSDITVDTTAGNVLNPQGAWQSETGTRHAKVKQMFVNRIG